MEKEKVLFGLKREGSLKREKKIDSNKYSKYQVTVNVIIKAWWEGVVWAELVT